MNERSVTTADLAGMCDVTTWTINSWLRGATQPKAGQVARICAALSCEIGDLYADVCFCPADDAKSEGKR